MDVDQLKCRCPRLGGPVNFAYCRHPGEHQQPCFKVFDCWWECFDVVSYLREHLSDEAFAELSERRPAPKVTSLLELIDQARQRATRSD